MQSLFDTSNYKLTESYNIKMDTGAGTFKTNKKTTITRYLLPLIMTTHSIKMEVDGIPDSDQSCVVIIEWDHIFQCNKMKKKLTAT